MSTTLNPQMPMPPCDSAKQMILDRQFENWHGLPTDCDWTEFTGPLPTDWSRVPGRSMLTDYAHPASVSLKIDGYYLPYFTYVDGKLVLFDGSPRKTAESDAALIAHLGSPEQCLAWQEGTESMPATECVYAARGITLFMNSDRSRIVHVALYPPCTATHYARYLRPNLAKEPPILPKER
jgi:hypothetical protein